MTLLEGELLLGLAASRAQPFGDHALLVESGGVWSVYSVLGEYPQLVKQYTRIILTDNPDYAVVEDAGKYGVINTDGVEVVQPIYVSILAITDRYIVVEDKEENKIVLNMQGKCVDDRLCYRERKTVAWGSDIVGCSRYFTCRYMLPNKPDVLVCVSAVVLTGNALMVIKCDDKYSYAIETETGLAEVCELDDYNSKMEQDVLSVVYNGERRTHRTLSTTIGKVEV